MPDPLPLSRGVTPSSATSAECWTRSIATSEPLLGVEALHIRWFDGRGRASFPKPEVGRTAIDRHHLFGCADLALVRPQPGSYFVCPPPRVAETRDSA